jgi:hypothetical protein
MNDDLMEEPDSKELRQSIKLQEEEELPSPRSSKDAIKELMRSEIRQVLTEMLVEGDSLILPKTVSSPVQQPKPIQTPEPKRSAQSFIDDVVLSEKHEQHEDSVNDNEDDGEDAEEPDPALINDDNNPIHEPNPSGADGSPMPNEAPDPFQAEHNEWVTYENSQHQSTDYLENEWDHRSYLLGTKYYEKDVMQLHELVLKELSLSNLPDTELAFIYSVKMDCIEEWLSMGFYELAQQRLVHMLFRLRLMTSVEALELIAQHGTSAISMSMDRGEMQREGLPDQEQEGRTRLGLGGILNRVKGRK